jgi:hypothetical protein
VILDLDAAPVACSGEQAGSGLELPLAQDRPTGR